MDGERFQTDRSPSIDDHMTAIQSSAGHPFDRERAAEFDGALRNLLERRANGDGRLRLVVTIEPVRGTTAPCSLRTLARSAQDRAETDRTQGPARYVSMTAMEEGEEAIPGGAASTSPIGRGEHARARVLRAALEILAGEGLAALTMDAVARRAEASKATLYRRWAHGRGCWSRP